MGPGRRMGVVLLGAAMLLAGCAPGLSAEADAWCQANPDAVFRAATLLKQRGSTSGWDRSRDEYRQACQRAWDTRAAASPATAGA